MSIIFYSVTIIYIATDMKMWKKCGLGCLFCAESNSFIGIISAPHFSPFFASSLGSNKMGCPGPWRPWMNLPVPVISSKSIPQGETAANKKMGKKLGRSIWRNEQI
jgi:hypothetical protein